MGQFEAISESCKGTFEHGKRHQDLAMYTVSCDLLSILFAVTEATLLRKIIRTFDLLKLLSKCIC